MCYTPKRMHSVGPELRTLYFDRVHFARKKMTALVPYEILSVAGIHLVI